MHITAKAISDTIDGIDALYAKAAESLATVGRESRYGGFSMAAPWLRNHERQLKAARRLTCYLVELTTRTVVELGPQVAREAIEV